MVKPAKEHHAVWACLLGKTYKRIMRNKELIEVIKRSNIPVDQKQEIIKRINHTADPGQIVLIIMEFLELGLGFLDRFPPP